MENAPLIAEWIFSGERPAAWIALDASDRDLRVCLRHVLIAVQSRFPEACAESAGLLDVTELPAVLVLACTLANGLGSIDARFTLVLDGDHEVRGPGVHDLMVELMRQCHGRTHSDKAVSQAFDVTEGWGAGLPLPAPAGRVLAMRWSKSNLLSVTPPCIK